MVLLGCILSIKKKELKKIFLKVASGIIIGVIFHFFSDIVKTLGQTGSLNIFFLQFWAPPIIFNLFLLSTLIHFEDG